LARRELAQALPRLVDFSKGSSAHWEKLVFGRTGTIAILALWLCSTIWLFVAKILPPLLVGDPPSFQAIYGDAPSQESCAWDIHWNGKPLGWARSEHRRRADGIFDIESSVHFDRLPIKDVAPPWMRSFVDALGELERLPLDAKSTLTIDPLGQLVGFRSGVDLGPFERVVSVQGVADGDRLRVSVQADKFFTETELYLPPHAIIADGLAPQARLTALRVGQAWTEPVYSPFRPPHEPMEILRATVARRQTIDWGGRDVSCVLVEYRRENGVAVAADALPQGRAWVNDEGLVLRQELQILNATLVFVRRASDPPTEGARADDAAPTP
jgi:hypothetical protein